MEADERVVISGGEPALSKNIFEILELCKSNKKIKEVELQSNGAIFFYKDFLNKIKNLRAVDEFNIHFSSHIKELDKKITQSNLFDYKIKGIQNLIDANQNVRLTFVINKLNYKIMLNYLKFVNSKWKNAKIQLSFVQIQGKVLKNLSLVPSYTELKPYLLKSLEFAKKNKMRIYVDNIPLCLFPKNKEFSVDFIKKPSKKPSFHPKKIVKKCSGCILKANCFGPPTDYLKIFGDREISPIK
jgi:MoaA/NifB/PqqE/SkfB family radical SAM enzyme